jgi:hypothetical protein
MARFEPEPARGRFRFMGGRKITGAAMLELVALVTAATLIPVIVVLGLFRLAGLKRLEDLQPPQRE